MGPGFLRAKAGGTPTKSGGSIRAAAVKESAEMSVTLDLQARGMPREKCLCRRSTVMGVLVEERVVGPEAESISVMKAVVRGTLR